MAAKRGGTRQASAAVAKAAAADAPAFPAEDTPTLEGIVTTTETPDENTPAKAAAADAPATALDSAADAPETPDATATAPNTDEQPTGRLAALAALTGAPTTPDAPTPAPAVEVTPNGRESIWADGDTELVTAIVTVTSYQGVINGARLCAYHGETLHATEAIIARGVKFGALERVI